MDRMASAETISRPSLIRRYGWVVYWLAFAAYTLNAARNPGFVRHPEAVPYPWTQAVLTCALLGIETASLNAVLRPLGNSPSVRRVVAASALAVLFALFSVVTLVTDMPGYYYAPRVFAIVNVVVVPLVGTGLMLKSVFSRRSRSTSRPYDKRCD
jgi:hypothetical protein